MDTGIPKPITRPKLNAKLVAAISFFPIFPSKNSGTIGRNPSLNTAIPLFANTAHIPPNNAIATNSIIFDESIFFPPLDYSFFQLIHDDRYNRFFMLSCKAKGSFT